MISSRSNIVGRAKIVGPPQRFNLVLSFSGDCTNGMPIFVGGSNLFSSSHSKLYNEEEFFPAGIYEITPNLVNGIMRYSTKSIDRKTGLAGPSISVEGKNIDPILLAELIKTQPLIIKEMIVTARIKTSVVRADFIEASLGAFDIENLNTYKDSASLKNYFNPDVELNKIFIPCNIIMNSNNGFFFKCFQGAGTTKIFDIAITAFPINL